MTSWAQENTLMQSAFLRDDTAKKGFISHIYLFVDLRRKKQGTIIYDYTTDTFFCALSTTNSYEPCSVSKVSTCDAINVFMMTWDKSYASHRYSCVARVLLHKTKALNHNHSHCHIYILPDYKKAPPDRVLKENFLWSCSWSCIKIFYPNAMQCMHSIESHNELVRRFSHERTRTHTHHVIT